MPRNTDYSKCVIYIIRHPELGLEYVGHTTNFNARKYSHKACASMPNPTQRVYQSIQANGGWTAWEMVKIAEFPCKTMQEAGIEEERHRVERGSSLNTYRAHTTQEQRAKQRRKCQAKYAAGHPERVRDRMTKYRAKHREQLKEQKAKYNAEHRDEINARRRAARAKKRAEAAK
jgi:hypothetical protein